MGGRAGHPPRAQEQTYARAIELEVAGNHPAALALLWEAAGLAPRDPEIQNALGEALDRIGALDGAIAAYRAALHENPHFRKASNNLILALVKVGKGEEAVDARASARRRRIPDDPDRYFTLGLAQSEQNIDDAIAELSPRARARAAPRARALQPRARANRIRSDVGGDRRAEADAGHRSPQPQTHYMLGRHLLASGGLRSRPIRRTEAAIAANQSICRRARRAGSPCLKARRTGKARQPRCGARSHFVPIRRPTTRSRRCCSSRRRRGGATASPRRAERLAPAAGAGSAGQRARRRSDGEARCRGLRRRAGTVSPRHRRPATDTLQRITRWDGRSSGSDASTKPVRPSRVPPRSIPSLAAPKQPTSA